MPKTRLLTLLLSLALALTMAPAVLAQDESPAPEGATEGEGMSSEFDPSGVEEWDEDEALILYNMLQTRLLEIGVVEEDMDEAMAYLGEQLAGMSEEDLEDLAELMAAQAMTEELMTEEEGEKVDIGDDEFMQSDEEEPDIDIDIGDEEEEEE